jgi:hypothetical protein
LSSFPHAPVGSGCTQCNNIARIDATLRWITFESLLASFPESVPRHVGSYRDGLLSSTITFLASILAAPTLSDTQMRPFRDYLPLVGMISEEPSGVE